MVENILEIKNLNKTIKNFQLKDVSFSLKKGYIMGFIGRNGAGKTTTLKLIMNLLKKDSGSIKVFGQDHIQYEKSIKNRIGFVYDECFLYEYMSLIEIKKIIAPFYSKWDDKKFNDYIDLFELPIKKRIKQLSKGMKMKFSLAIALSHHADFIIMDEPTSGLDPIFRNEFLELLSDLLQDENKGILLSSHITTDLEKIADYITFIHEGKIILSDAKDDLLENNRIIKGSKDLLTKDLKKNFTGIKENAYGFTGLIKNEHNFYDLFSDQVVIEKPTLEDIMIYHAKEKTSC